MLTKINVLAIYINVLWIWLCHGTLQVQTKTWAGLGINEQTHRKWEFEDFFFEESFFFFWMFCNQNCSQNYPSLNLREITYPKSSNLTDWCWVIPWPRQEFWDLLRKVLHHENLNSKLKEKISNNTAKPYFWTFSLWH